MVGIGDLLRQLPDTYSGGTTEIERLAHFDLFRKFQAEVENPGTNDQTEPILVSWAPQSQGSKVVLLHLCFRDVAGSLSAITAALAEYSIAIVRAAAFCTEAGVAIDTLELQCEDHGSMNEIVEVVRTRLRGLRLGGLASLAIRAGVASTSTPSSRTQASKAHENELTRQLPADYLQSTTAAERLAHLELYRSFIGAGDQYVALSWAPVSDEAHSHLMLHLVFRDAIGSLSAITSTLTELGINMVRVAAFCTEAGVAVDWFELSHFDQSSADIITARLKALIEGQTSRDAPATPWPGGTAVAFQISWRGTLGGRRGARGELAVGASWFAIGQATMDAPALHFVQEDFHDTLMLHLGFTHKRKEHTIAMRFAKKADRVRGNTLLVRLRTVGDAMGAAASGTDTAAGYSSGQGGGIDGSMHGGSMHGGSMHGGSMHGGSIHGGSLHDAHGVFAGVDWASAGDKFKPLPPGSSASQRNLGPSSWTSAAIASVHRAARLAASGFEPSPAEAARETACGRCGWRFLLLLVVTSATLAAAAIGHMHAAHAWQPYRAPFHPASCTISSLEVDTQYKEAREQQCSHKVRHCSKLFYVVRAVWHVEVRLLGRYIDPTEQDRNPSLGKYPPPREMFLAAAQPTLHPKHLHAAPGRIVEGVCAGEIGWGRNATLTWCMSDGLSHKWLPQMHKGLTYGCSAETFQTPVVFFDVQAPPSLWMESSLVAIAWVVALSLALTSAVVTMARCCMARETGIMGAMLFSHSTRAGPTRSPDASRRPESSSCTLV